MNQCSKQGRPAHKRCATGTYPREGGSICSNELTHGPWVESCTSPCPSQTAQIRRGGIPRYLWNMHVAISLRLMLAQHGLPSHSLSECTVCMQLLEVYHLVRWPTVESKPQQQDACHVEDHIVAGHRHRLAVSIKSALARAGHPGTCQTCHSAHHVHGTWRAHGNTIVCCYQKDAMAQETAGSRPSAAVRPQACN